MVRLGVLRETESVNCLLPAPSLKYICKRILRSRNEILEHLGLDEVGTVEFRIVRDVARDSRGFLELLEGL